MSTSAGATPRRKLDHVRINLEKPVDSAITTGLERYRLIHQALPELDLSDVSLATSFLGKHLQVPLLVSSMTGGAAGLTDLNRRLAEAAQARGLAMGVGSQRAAIETPELAQSFDIRDQCPDILLMANLGAVQLNYGYGVDDCRRAVEMIRADALILHLNPLQEAVQPEGDTRWRGLLARVEAVARALPVPVIVKEVGWGIAPRVAKQLADAGVAAIDVAGAGGTSWSEVERHRAASESDRSVAAAFAGWGIPTADSLRMVREAAPDMALIASGGLRDGIDVAKVLALGAGLAGLAGPLLKAAAESTEAVIESVDILARTLRIALFATGAVNVEALADGSRITRVQA